MTDTKASDGAPTRAPEPSRGRRRREQGRRSIPPTFYLMVLPALVLFFVFHTIPVIQGVYYSFTDSPGYGPYEFVGFSNYIALFSDPRVVHAYWFTFLIAGVATVLVNIVSLAIAVALNGKIKWKTGLRGVYFIPNVLAILVVGYIFNYLFNNSLPVLGEQARASASSHLAADQGEHRVDRDRHPRGVAGGGLQHHHLHRRSPDGAGGALRGRGAGRCVARGSSSAAITFPMIAGFFTINMVLSLKGFLQIFDHIVALTGGGPGTDTESVALLIYKGGFQGGEYGYQSANSVVFFVVIVVLSIVQLRFLQRREMNI